MKGEKCARENPDERRVVLGSPKLKWAAAKLVDLCNQVVWDRMEFGV